MVIAFDLKQMTELWTLPVPKRSEWKVTPRGVRALTYAAGRFYFGAENGNIYAVDPAAKTLFSVEENEWNSPTGVHTLPQLKIRDLH